MADRYKKQRENRRKVFCTLQIPGMGWITGSTRKQPDCSEVEKLPGRFYAPEEGVKVTTAYKYPSAVPLGNSETTVTCGIDNPATQGNAVTIGANTYITHLSWRHAGKLEQYQLKHLQELGSEAINTYFTNETVTIAGMQALFKLSTEQATGMFDEFSSITTDLAVFTHDQAVALLECVWTSKEVTLTCPASSFTVEDLCLGTLAFSAVENSVTIAAGTYTSNISQADADTQALNAAKSSLVCTFSNDEKIVVECCDPDVDELIDGYSLVLRSDIPSAAYHPGDLTASDAESVGESLDSIRRFLLNCRCAVVDPEQTLGPLPIEEDFCSNIDLGDPDPEDPEYTNTPKTCQCPADAVKNPAAPYNYTYTVAAGEFTGRTQEEADADAVIDCAASLNCVWTNDDTYGVCDELTIEAAFVPAGTYFSDDSKEDANEMAQEAADKLSQCGEACDTDECFCATQEEAESRMAGNSLGYYSPLQRNLIRDALVPCGMGSNVPWVCTAEAMATRIAIAQNIGTTSAMEAAEEMNRHCAAQNAGKSVRRKPCGPNGAICWKLPEGAPEPSDPSDPGGPNGDGTDGDCDDGCECLTAVEAQGQFDNPITCSDRPCGITHLDHEVPTPKYCFRENRVNPPTPPDPGPNPGPAPDPDTDPEPPDPPDTACQDGCTCYTPDGAGTNMTSCSGAPCGMLSETVMYCYKEKTTPPNPNPEPEPDPDTDPNPNPSPSPTPDSECDCTIDLQKGCDSSPTNITADDDGKIKITLPEYQAGDGIEFTPNGESCTVIGTSGMTGEIRFVASITSSGTSLIPSYGTLIISHGVITDVTYD